MSDVPYLSVDEFDGTHGYVKVKAFVNYEVDLNYHGARKYSLGNRHESDEELFCIVFDDEIELEPGHGYFLGGYDNEWEEGEQIQLKICSNGFATEIWSPDND